MSGNIDPLFADHPFFREQKERAAQLLKTMRDEAALEEIKHLTGEALDKRLRELGMDPDKLLALGTSAFNAGDMRQSCL